MKRQNRKLRSLIREEIGLAEAVSEAQLVQMGLKEIRELIAEAKRKKRNRWEYKQRRIQIPYHTPLSILLCEWF